jgi:hypothetical protein
MNEKDDNIAHPGVVYQNPKKHLILAQFSNSPWTGFREAQGCSGRIAGCGRFTRQPGGKAEPKG